MRNIALITGILGQDGAYLAEFLLKKNYKVIGISRNLSSFKKWRLKKLNIESKVILERKDICKISDIKFILKKYKINEIYNFAAQSYVNKSFVLPLETVNVNTSVVGKRQTFDLKKLLNLNANKFQSSIIKSRCVYFNGKWLKTKVLQRENLPINYEFTGPAIIEQMDSTIVLNPKDRGVVDDYGNIVIDIG